jgi:hypothetical protein
MFDLETPIPPKPLAPSTDRVEVPIECQQPAGRT